MMDPVVFYLAYQGDVSVFQSVYIHTGDETADGIEENVRKTARAVLAGWWSARENREIASEFDMQDSNLIAVPHAFVVRATDAGWKLYQVDFTSGDMLESVVSMIGEGFDHHEMPTGWPNFMHGDDAP